MSVFNTKGTLLKWLKTLDQSLKDGILESVTVNSVSEGVITLSFNFADGSVITTPQIDIPQGAQGPQGPQGEQGQQGPQGEPGPDIFTDFDSLKIDTTDATVTYINGVAMITNARLIGYKSGGTEEVEIAVDLPIKAGDNVTVDASEDDKSILISAAGGGGGTTFYKLDAPESTVTTSTGKTINVIPASSSYFGTGSDINEYQDKLISGDLIFIGKLLLDNGKTIQFFAESLRVIVGSGIVIAYTDESILGEYGQSGQRIGVQYFVGGTPIN